MVAEQQQQQQQRDEPLVCKDIPVHGKYLINYKGEPKLKQKPKMSKYWGIQYLGGHKSISENDHPLKVEDQFHQIYHNATSPVKLKKDPKKYLEERPRNNCVTGTSYLRASSFFISRLTMGLSEI